MRYLLTAAACLCTFFSFAQQGSVSGKITDSSGKKLLPLTTITIFKAKDTSIVTYRLTNEQGEFKIPGLPVNVPLRMMATYSGYEAFRKDFMLTPTEPVYSFGSVNMINTAKQLDEVIVIAERPPVVIKKDTIEFNASAFKTLPNALLEDLLKKLPGVYVDENGDIKINGQKVNRLLVDGKRFFGDDPKMATRNLPSNLIDKVQVADDGEEIAQNNDGDMSKIGKVINITLKKAIKKAVFGRVFAGGGTDERYETGAIINTFRDTFQVSLLAFSNNLNKSSFNSKDITQLGGFSRSGWGNMNFGANLSGQQGFSLDGFSLGGTGSGISSASGAGININHSPSTRLGVSFQYMYGVTSNIADLVQNTQRFFGDTIVNTRLNTHSDANGRTHNTSTSFNWKPDSLSNLSIRVAYAFSGSDSQSPSLLNTDNNKVGQLNSGKGTQYSNAKSNNYNHYINYTHRFLNRKGRNLSVSHFLTYITNPASNITESLNSYVYPTGSNIVFQQLRATNTPSTRTNFNLNYSDPLSAKLTFRFNESVNYEKSIQDILTYGRHVSSGSYDSLNVSLSSNLTREHTRWSSNAGLSYKINSVTFNGGITWLQQWVDNRFDLLSQSSKLHFSNLLLGLSANWKRFNIGFSQDIYPPGINYLIPVPDNSNPFYITYGNANLSPTRRNGLNFNGSIYNTKTNTTLNIYAQSTVVDDAVIQSVTLNSNGVQVNRPVNVSGQWTNYLDISFNRQFKQNQRFFFTLNLGASMNYSRTPFIFNNEQSRIIQFGPSANTNLVFNWHDVVEFNPKYSVYTTQTSYTNKVFSDRHINSQLIQGELIIRKPKKIVWETNIVHRVLSEVAPGLPKTSTYWNAAITFLMFKEDKGQLRLSVNDILNSNANVNRYFNGNSIIDSRTNVLQRYFMISYIYNIRTLGGQATKVGGQQSLFRF